ncbi:TPA: hypothetical protein ACPZRZ_002638 [Yersinia enterocolitica]|uniref:hypothetical protein n=1 Tax=Yersinia TaxID=629 RepID=UPI0005B63FD2|nr:MULTISPECIES: hypothetical protein [Yersinia]EKN3882404.1 hypothetical protein [Yersinia enterocolitica]ELI7993216.1 hypothetical protein [Yersinia enterocolitica]ELW7357715.1 hypothetical protein [Yersinia enterocolitica]ELX2284354.1 hypothetical protein [Yersinia enterocolitica]EMA2898590.1 hypothetical protein [Yersinia enterocolitica]
MAKIDDYLPTQVEVDRVLFCKKFVDFSPLKWQTKPPPNRLKMQLVPMDEDGIPIYGLSFILLWKPDHDSFENPDESYPKMNLVALYHQKRIFAVDTYPFDKHKNSFKIEHPDFQDSINGPHYHLYYEMAGHYSEKIGFPITENIKPDDFIGYWNYFCTKLNVTCKGKIQLPLEDESGQMGFNL